VTPAFHVEVTFTPLAGAAAQSAKAAAEAALQTVAERREARISQDDVMALGPLCGMGRNLPDERPPENDRV
jgi:hypothetical protein